jgi:hypothetical protein
MVEKARATTCKEDRTSHCLLDRARATTYKEDRAITTTCKEDIAIHCPWYTDLKLSPVKRTQIAIVHGTQELEQPHVKKTDS